MVVRPPQEICEKIRRSAKQVHEHSRIDPHISIGSSFYSDKFSIFNKAKEWAETQQPFIFTLKKIDSFPNTKTIYITSDDQEEINQFNKLHDGFKSLLKKEVLYNKDFIEFCPHMTLENMIVCQKVKKTKKRFRNSFSEPIIVPITRIDITQKIYETHWEKIDSFGIGREQNAKFFFAANEYRFGNNNRASVLSS